MTIIVTCERGHQDRITIDHTRYMDPEQEMLWFEGYRHLLEWSSNDAPGAEGCVTCGAPVTVTKDEA